MENDVARYPMWQLTRKGRRNIEVAVAREIPVTIFLNDKELITLLCSPNNLDYLAAGFLSSEGLLNSRDAIRIISVNDQKGEVRVETVVDGESGQDILFKRISSGEGRGASFYSIADASSQKIESGTEISVDEVFTLVNEFQNGSQLWLSTHGVHSAALSDGKSILVFMEDIGRHNAIDKVFGKCLLEGIPTGDRIMMTSGRITSELLYKVSKRHIPIVISVSQPSDLGVRIADKLGITLISTVKGEKMNVITHDRRVVF